MYVTLKARHRNHKILQSIVQFQKMPILPPPPLPKEVPKHSKKCMMINSNFQRSWGGGGLPFWGEGMDIFWNYTIQNRAQSSRTAFPLKMALQNAAVKSYSHCFLASRSMIVIKIKLSQLNHFE